MAVRTETQFGKNIPDIARGDDNHLAFDVWHSDAEWMAHAPHNAEREAFEENIPDVPLLELELMLDSSAD